MFVEDRIQTQMDLKTLNDFLLNFGEKAASEAEAEQIHLTAVELNQDKDWHNPQKLAEQIVKRWSIPIRNQQVYTIYKILQSRQGNSFALGDCVLPAAIFVAARLGQGLTTEIYSFADFFHPYLIVQEPGKFLQVHFMPDKNFQAKAVVHNRNENFYQEEIVRQMRRLPDLLTLLQQTDAVKLDYIISELDDYKYDEKQTMFELKRSILG